MNIVTLYESNKGLCQNHLNLYVPSGLGYE